MTFKIGDRVKIKGGPSCEMVIANCGDSITYLCVDVHSIGGPELVVGRFAGACWFD